MKKILKKWESETGKKIIKWNETTLGDESSLYIEISNSMITINEIERLNWMLKRNGYCYTFDNLDIYNGKISLWFL